MNILESLIRSPRVLGILCAVGAVGLGLVYLAIAGAPMRYIGINVGALVIGLAMLALFRWTASADPRWTDGAIVAMAGALLATAVLGSDIAGAARWITVGGLSIQPSLMLLPVMLVAVAHRRSIPATAAIVVAAAAMALQPDRAMAAMLLLCFAALAVIRRDGHVVVALAAGAAGLAVTLARADTLPAVPFVDQIVYSSFDIHAGAGLAVLGGMAALLIPAVVGWFGDAENRATYVAFGAVWLAAIMAAVAGNYPTPIVGYGGSAIIGYALSLLALPGRARQNARAISRAAGETQGSPPHRHLFAAAA